MTIDLSQFVGKEVIVTLRNGEVIETVINLNENTVYPYSLGPELTCKTYTKDGHYYIHSQYDIVKIEHHCTNPMKIDLEEFVGREVGYNFTLNDSKPYNIKHIELKEPQQPQKPMTQLSDATIKKLADALTADAIKYLETDGEVIETLVSVINRFLTDRMGPMDENLLNELSVGISENFNLVSNIK